MKKFLYGFITAISLLVVSCNNQPSLQKYFVEKENDANFQLVDLSPSLLKLDGLQLSAAEKTAIASFKKMNVLIFKADSTNQKKQILEKRKISEILKDSAKYQELMRFGNNKEGIAIRFVGTDNNIEEFIVYGQSEKGGFGLVRIIGEDMKPENAMNLLLLMQKSSTDWSAIVGGFKL